MKKLLLLFVALIAASHLKAQQLPAVKLQPLPPELNRKAASTLTDSLLKESIGKSNLSVQQQQLLLPSFSPSNQVVAKLKAENFYSRMPVVKLHSDDPMPVAGRFDQMAYHMPVKRINIIKPDTASRQLAYNLAFPAMGR